MVKRVNKACSFFPCHKKLEDCTFCYCPFYPCLDKTRGDYIYSDKRNRNIWSCQECNWIHKKETVDEIFVLIRREYRQTPKASVNGLAKLNEKIGIIILGHGSKLHKANGLISKVAKIIRSQIADSVVQPSYLQFHQPALSKAIEKVAKKGCRKIIIVPFFLFKGNHVKRDIPQAIKKEISKYPRVSFVFTKSLGEDKQIGDIVLKNINEAIIKCA